MLRRIATRVGEIAVSVEGDQASPPLVLLHSVAHDHHDFDAIVASLRRTHRTIALDWPGHGESAMPDDPSSTRVETLWTALDDVIDALSLPPAVFLGNSVGGGAGVHLAATRPERVKGLVLVDSSGFTQVSAVSRAACWVQGRELVRRSTGKAFARWYLKERGPLVDAVLARIDANRAREGFFAVDAAVWRSFGTPVNDLRQIARTVRTPTLLVWGAHDPVLPANRDGAEARAALPHAQWVELDTGHAPFVEKPDAFLAAMVPFLQSLERHRNVITP